MPKSAIALLLALAAPALAKEPYRPLPRLSDDEVKRRKAESPPPGPSAPVEEPSASPPPTEPPAIARGAPAAPDRLPPGPDVARPATPPTPEAFREGLSPYGSKAWSTERGSIRRPRVDAGWKPYYRSQWVWSDAGWTWASSEPGAWAAYPYGWRVGEVGWAPLHRLHHLPVPRFAVAPHFHGGLFPRAFSAARPAPQMARGPAWGGPRGFGSPPVARLFSVRGN